MDPSPLFFIQINVLLIAVKSADLELLENAMIS